MDGCGVFDISVVRGLIPVCFIIFAQSYELRERENIGGEETCLVEFDERERKQRDGSGSSLSRRRGGRRRGGVVKQFLSGAKFAKARSLSKLGL